MDPPKIPEHLRHARTPTPNIRRTTYPEDEPYPRPATAFIYHNDRVFPKVHLQTDLDPPELQEYLRYGCPPTMNRRETLDAGYLLDEPYPARPATAHRIHSDRTYISTNKDLPELPDNFRYDSLSNVHGRHPLDTGDAQEKPYPRPATALRVNHDRLMPGSHLQYERSQTPTRRQTFETGDSYDDYPRPVTALRVQKDRVVGGRRTVSEPVRQSTDGTLETPTAHRTRLFHTLALFLDANPPPYNEPSISAFKDRFIKDAPGGLLRIPSAVQGGEPLEWFLGEYRKSREKRELIGMLFEIIHGMKEERVEVEEEEEERESYEEKEDEEWEDDTELWEDDGKFEEEY